MGRPPKVVPLPSSKDDAAIAVIGTGNYTIAGLMREFKLSRWHVKYLIEQYAPKDKIKIRNARRPKEEPPPEVANSFLSHCNSVAIAMIGVALGGVGIALNYQFSRSLGQTELSSHLLGVLGVACDSATICLPSIWLALLAKRHYGQFMVSLFIYLVCLGLSTIAAMSFAATNIGDSLQTREAVALHRQALNAEFASDKAEMDRIGETPDPRVIEEKIQITRGSIPPKALSSSHDCTDVTISGAVCAELNQLRASKHNAERRIELDTRMRTLNEEIAALPPITAKDPGADYISHAFFGFIRPQDVEGFRIIGFACLPGLAGLILMFARKINHTRAS